MTNNNIVLIMAIFEKLVFFFLKLTQIKNLNQKTNWNAKIETIKSRI